MMDDRFNGTELAVGTMVGHRVFQVFDGGMLGSVTQPNAMFEPGENIGAHHTAHDNDDLPESHRVGMLDCGCGYYAYFGGVNSEYFHPRTTVEAIIEGYGLVTEGTLGFRAEKARLLALVQPNPAYLSRCSAIHPTVPEWWDAVRSRYDVPVYGTLQAALAAHPPTKWVGDFVIERDGVPIGDQPEPWIKPEQEYMFRGDWARLNSGAWMSVTFSGPNFPTVSVPPGALVMGNLTISPADDLEEL